MKIGDLVKLIEWNEVGLIVKVDDKTIPKTIHVKLINNQQMIVTYSDEVEVINVA